MVYIYIYIYIYIIYDGKMKKTSIYYILLIQIFKIQKYKCLIIYILKKMHKDPLKGSKLMEFKKNVLRYSYYSFSYIF